MPITTITRVSTSSTGEQSNSGSFSPSISADGRFVAFHGGASNLVSGSTNNAFNVFVKDLHTGLTTCVSTDSLGGQGNGESLDASISADGSYIAFWSDSSNLVPGDTNDRFDVFVKALQTGNTTRVSTSSTGEQSNLGSYPTSISADGQYIAFWSNSSNLVPGDTNGLSDTFVKNLQTGLTTRVSTDSLGRQGNGGSSSASISADGRYIAFSSDASNLVVDDTNDNGDVFVKDLQTGLTTRVSTDSLGGQVNGGGGGASISADGRYVAFSSGASNLVAGDTNNSSDVFVKDLQTGLTTRVSTDSLGEQGNSQSEAASISADGRYIAFYSAASNLVPGDTNVRFDVFVRDLQTGLVARLSIDSAGRECNNSSVDPVISADGRFITFWSYGSNLVSGDTNSATDIFVTPNPLWGTNLPLLTEGPDTWFGTAGNDSIDALAGNDSLNGAGGNDSLIAGAGNDTLTGGIGADTLAGGEGDDVYTVDVTDRIAYEPAGRGLDKVYSSGNFTLTTGLNQLFLTGTAGSSGTGNDGDNLLGGNAGANRLSGMGGRDDLYGLAGNDSLDGGNGNDILRGGAGSDRLIGGVGGDRFVFTGPEVTDATADLDIITDYSRTAGDAIDLLDPVHGYTVIGVVGGALQIRLAGGSDIVQFSGITDIDDIVFV